MNLGMPEIIFILLLALVLVGPRKLPELGRQLGKYLAEFKRASNEFKRQIETEMLNIELQERAKKAQDDPKVLPPEEPWERLMRPITETVSRTGLGLAGMMNPEPPPSEPASAASVEQPSSSITSSGSK